MSKKKGRTLTVKRLRNEYPLKDEAMEMALARRAAHCLNWCAENYPKQYIPWHWLYQAVIGQARTPKPEAKDVIALRKRSSSIRVYCYDMYGRTIHLHKGLGVRALVDDADVLEYALPGVSKRFQSSRNSLVKTTSLISARKVPNTPALRPLKQWFVDDISRILKQVGSERFAERLLPPAPDEEDE